MNGGISRWVSRAAHGQGSPIGSRLSVLSSPRQEATPMIRWHRLAALSFAAIIFIPQPVGSQRIYRCVDADGQVLFSNDPGKCVDTGSPAPPPGSRSKPPAEKTEAPPSQARGDPGLTVIKGG